MKLALLALAPLALAVASVACSSNDAREDDATSQEAVSIVPPRGLPPTLLVATPVVSPPGGTYGTEPLVLTFTDATAGANLCVRDDGLNPVCAPDGDCAPGQGTRMQPGATLAVTLDGEPVKVVACHAGMTPSPIVSGIYDLIVPPPVISPPAGTYTTSPTVLTVTDATPGATLCVSDDGMLPSCENAAAPQCSPGNITVTPGKTIPITASGTPVRAIACHVGMASSVVVEQVYTLVTAAPTFAPPAETSTQPIQVTLSSATAGATICYTTNGVTPTCGLNTCPAPGEQTYQPGHAITFDASADLQAVACGPDMVTSPIVSQVYQIVP